MGIVAEIVAGAKSYRNIKWNIASFSLFCLGPAGVFLAYFADPAAWAETMLNNGTSQEYIDMMTASDNDFAPFLNIMNEWYAKDTSNK